MGIELSPDQVLLMREIRLRGEGYGIQLQERVFRNFGRKIPSGGLYVKLRELESLGLLESEPRLEDPEKRGGRPRYYYKLTGSGRRIALPASEQVETAPAGIPGLVPG